MSREQNHAPQSAFKTNVTMTMLRTLLSTNLRIFGPVLVLFGVGLTIDIVLAYQPLGMVLGVMVGIVVAIALVIKQLHNIKQGAS
jgi:F0F1-type ATP synthase assembly protein I